MGKDLGGVTGGHGFAVSPIIFEDLLIVPNDQEKGGVPIMLDSATGEIRWKVPRGSKRLTYSTPCIFTSPRRTRINLYELVVRIYQPSTKDW